MPQFLILFLIPLNGEQRSKIVESETAMAVSLLSHLPSPISLSTVDAHVVGSVGGAFKSSFLHCTKLFSTPKLGRSAFGEVTEENISSSHNCLDNGGMWSLSGVNDRGPSKYSMSVSMYHGRRDVSTLSFDLYR
ncbi:hypothetical protein AAG906_030905 [Vitis piasezkii]